LWNDLKDKIASVLEEASDPWMKQKEEVAKGAFERVKDRLGQMPGDCTIDEYIEQSVETDSGEFEQFMRRAIALVLVRAEARDSDNSRKGWVEVLANAIADRHKETLATTLTIISFNYERCFQFRLDRALHCELRGSKPVDRPLEGSFQLSITYPHGHLGSLVGLDLNWQVSAATYGQDSVAAHYGQANYETNLQTLSSLRTVDSMIAVSGRKGAGHAYEQANHHLANCTRALVVGMSPQGFLTAMLNPFDGGKTVYLSTGEDEYKPYLEGDNGLDARLGGAPACFLDQYADELMASLLEDRFESSA